MLQPARNLHLELLRLRLVTSRLVRSFKRARTVRGLRPPKLWHGFGHLDGYDRENRYASDSASCHPSSSIEKIPAAQLQLMHCDQHILYASPGQCRTVREDSLKTIGSRISFQPTVELRCGLGSGFPSHGGYLHSSECLSARQEISC